LRVTAGAAGFLVFSQSRDRPERQRDPLALGHDPLTTKGTGVLAEQRPILLELLIEHQPRSRLAHQPGQKSPAYC